MRIPPGIRPRHARKCPAHADPMNMAICKCRPSYQAQAGPRAHRMTATKPSLSAAIGWKGDIEKAFRDGLLPAAEPISASPTFAEAAESFMRRAESGAALTRSDKRYRSSTLRGYRRTLTIDLGPIADTPVDQITRGQLNRLVQSMMERGIAPQTVRNAIVPVRAVFRDLMDLEVVTTNPTTGVKVPKGDGRRLRVLTPDELASSIAALPAEDRPVWATAAYAGLRRGELMALRWEDVDLAGCEIVVRYSYDPGSRTMGRVKSDAGQDRRVPIVAALRDHLTLHRQRTGARRGLVFAREHLAHARLRDDDRSRPFSSESLTARAERAWTAAGLQPWSLHVGRHTFASLTIAALAAAGEWNPKALQDLMGHATIGQTYDRYGHLFPGTRERVGRLVDEFIDNATGDGARAANTGSVRRLLEDLAARGLATDEIADLTATTLDEWLRDNQSAVRVTVRHGVTSNGAAHPTRGSPEPRRSARKQG